MTKDVPAELVRVALEAGVRDVGENRVQEGVAKRAALAGEFPSVDWHFIGHLQTNKAARAAENFDLIHSLDSPRLAEAISRSASRRAVPVLIQVNVSGEGTKFGVPPGEVESLARAVSRLPGLELRGLMTIAPLTDDPETVRPVFRYLRELAGEVDRLRLPGVRMELLSMGMSQDYEVAVSEGATLVRIGTAIFGPRGG